METIKGVVVEGKQKGRKLGFPTANIKINSDLNIKPGIYAGRIVIGAGKHNSALYLPGDGIIEAFIFNFSENLYGKEVGVELVKRIRDKKDFKNDDEAKKQIASDVEEIKKCLQE